MSELTEALEPTEEEREIARGLCGLRLLPETVALILAKYRQDIERRARERAKGG